MSQFLPLKMENPLFVLKEWLNIQKNVFEFSANDYSSLLVCQILVKEMGGPNDSLSRYIYDVEKKQKIDRSEIVANVGTLDFDTVIQIELPKAKHLDVTLSYLREIISCEGNKIIISPSQIVDYLHSHGLTPVFVVPWIQQILFSQFDIRSESAGEQLWVLRNNDIYLYSKLVAERKIIFQSTHDLVGHIAGTKTEGVSYAAEIAAMIHIKLQHYFGADGRGNLPSHLLPFLIGIFLDDLTQPPNYFSARHTQAIHVLLSAMDDLAIDPNAALVLNSFPTRVNAILQMVRGKSDFSLTAFKHEVKKLVIECKELTAVYVY